MQLNIKPISHPAKAQTPQVDTCAVATQRQSGRKITYTTGSQLWPSLLTKSELLRSTSSTRSQCPALDGYSLYVSAKWQRIAATFFLEI